MSRPLELAKLLLFTSALVAPSVVLAQTAPAPEPAQETPPAATAEAAAPTQTTPDASAEQPAQEVPEVSVPGAAPEVTVTARRSGNISRSTPQVVSILSSADIARTGEGDIAGSLSRVTGLSVVGNGFVYVRGLGDRYSLALLNGSPLPSPEPLKRVVPLDLFPTSIIASSLVQKSYSVNFPGEFGGGVINLTTKSTPKKPFLSIGGSIGADTRTTGQLGYTHFGSASDWLGYDNGTRDVPPALQAFFDSGNRISNLSTIAQNTTALLAGPTGGQQTIAAQLINPRTAIAQRNKAIPPNWSANITGGKSWDVGSDATLGLIATAGFSSKWRTRDITQQTANALNLSSLDRNFERVVTDNRAVVNGLVAVSLDFGKNKLRWTNLYIHDTLKQTRIGIGSENADSPGVTFQDQDTGFYARQLIDTQFVAEMKLTPELNLDFRAGYANSRRDAPSELSFTYSRSNAANDPYGALFLNTLNVGRDAGSATIAYSKLNEDLFSTGVDVSYKIAPELTATVGYAFSDTNRRTDRRSFLFQGNGNIPQAVSALRPDLLLAPSVIRFYGIGLVDNEGGNPSFRARLRNHAGYLQLQADVTPELGVNVGVRYETARQSVDPITVYTVAPVLPPATLLNRDYWLPGFTITYKLNEKMQFRVSASKTIARPQFRELVFQTYYDPESNVVYRGNPRLVDSQLYNAEARYEWYFARDQRLSVAGFYKQIDKPIETYASFDGNNVFTSFANAPRATLYGAEIEAQKYFDLSGWKGNFWASRRAIVVANYTYTKSSIGVKATDPVQAFPLSVTLANQLFRNGAPLTGQSDHLANVELGLEDKDHLSQQTLLLSYASRRATRRGPSGQPDLFEEPGFRLDFVARQGVRIAGIETELKFEARNITGTKYQEFQQSGTNKVFYNLYNVGTTVSLGLGVNF